MKNATLCYPAMMTQTHADTAKLANLESVARMIAMIASSAVASAVAVAAWFAVNFLGKPILAIREKRLEALQFGERYSHVSSRSSDELRDTALKSLHDVGNALLAYSRERSIATRLWCWIFRYDLELAARCLFGLAEGARGEYSIPGEQRKNTLNALYVSLGATWHLSRQEIETMNRELAAVRRNELT
jgi:hypothetical protein